MNYGSMNVPSNFERALAVVLKFEGGRVFRSEEEDPGGKTNKGITQKTYDNYILSMHNGKNDERLGRSVYDISDQDVKNIYEQQYWDTISGNYLPIELQLAIFDYAVHSGVNQAVKDVQRIVGVEVDGIMGVYTISAIVNGNHHAVFVTKLCSRRLAFMKKLKNWKYNKNGWTKRVNTVQAISLGLVGQKERSLDYEDIHKVDVSDDANKKASSKDQKFLTIPKIQAGTIGGVVASVSVVINEIINKTNAMGSDVIWPMAVIVLSALIIIGYSVIINKDD